MLIRTISFSFRAWGVSRTMTGHDEPEELELSSKISIPPTSKEEADKFIPNIFELLKEEYKQNKNIDVLSEEPYNIEYYEE